MHASVSFVRVVGYHCHINPYFDYCNIVWAVDRSTLSNELFIRQMKALRTITIFDVRQHIRPLFVSLKVLQYTRESAERSATRVFYVPICKWHVATFFLPYVSYEFHLSLISHQNPEGVLL
jgi:hypothetical protein